jgi:Uma2 family endonuclease
MRAVMLEVPEALLEQRRRTGVDRWDEVWEGVLHMVPPPSDPHQAFGTYLLLALGPIATAAGLESRHKGGYFRAAEDYRQPDLLFARREHFTHRGLEGPAELVVEILSPGDESRDKLGFYAAMSVSEVLLVDPVTREFEMLGLAADGSYEPVALDDAGEAPCRTLGVAFSVAAGPKFRVVSAGDIHEV